MGEARPNGSGLAIPSPKKKTQHNPLPCLVIPEGPNCIGCSLYPSSLNAFPSAQIPQLRMYIICANMACEPNLWLDTGQAMASATHPDLYNVRNVHSARFEWDQLWMLRVVRRHELHRVALHARCKPLVHALRWRPLFLCQPSQSLQNAIPS